MRLSPAALGTLGLGNMLPEAEMAALKVSLLQAVSPEPILWPRASARMEESSLCTVGLGMPAVLSQLQGLPSNPCLYGRFYDSASSRQHCLWLINSVFWAVCADVLSSLPPVLRPKATCSAEDDDDHLSIRRDPPVACWPHFSFVPSLEPADWLCKVTTGEAHTGPHLAL